MAGELGKVVVVVGGETSGLDKAMDGVGKVLEGTKKQVAGAHDAFSQLWQQFTLGQIAANVVTKALGSVKSVITDSITESMDYEKSLNGMANAFAISGRDIPGVTTSLAAFADEMVAAGLASDDEILKAETLLLSLTKLDEQGIKRATEGAVGLASVFGMSLQSATEAVAKGFEGNFMALGRLIPSIRDAKTEGEKHSAMVKALSGFYQQAIGDTKTFAGETRSLGLAWKETKQSLGDLILNTGLLQAASSGASGILKILAGNTNDLKEAQTQGYLAVRDFQNSLQILKPTMEEMRKAKEEGTEAWEKYKEATKRADDALVANKDTIAGWIDKGLSFLGVVKEQAPAIEKVATAAATQATPALEEVKKAEVILAQTVDIANGFLSDQEEQFIQTAAAGSTAYADMVEDVNAGLDSIAAKSKESNDAIVENSGTATTDVSSRWDDLIRDITQGWADGLQGLVEGTMSFKDFLGDTWDAVKKTFFRFIADQVTKWITGQLTMSASSAAAATAISSSFKSIGTAIKDVAGAILDVIEDIAKTVVDIVAYAIETLAEAIAAAAKSLAAAAPDLLLVGAVAIAIYAGFALVKGLVDKIIGGGGGGAGDGMGRVVERQDKFLAIWNWFAPGVAEDLVSIYGRTNRLVDQLDNLAGCFKTQNDVIRTSAGTIVGAVDGVKSAVSTWGGNIVAAVKALNPSAYASGGVAWSPQLATVAENGPELIIPLSNISSGGVAVGNTGAGAGGYAGASASGGAITNYITINAQTLDDNTIRRASEKIYAAVEYEKMRRGRA